MNGYKHTLLILLAVALLAGCADKPGKPIAKQNDWTALKLKGKVHTRIDTTYVTNEVDGQMQRQEDLSYMGMAFDTNGFMTSKYFLTPENVDNSDVNVQYTYKFDQAGNKIERDVIDKLLHEDDERFTYNEQGNLIERRSYATGGQHKTPADDDFEFKNIYSYDTSGRLTAKATIFKKEDHKYTETYDYDAAGRLAAEHHSTAGSSQWTMQYKYDEKGNLIQRTRGDIIWNFTNELDAIGNNIKEIEQESHSVDMPQRQFVTVTHYTYY